MDKINRKAFFDAYRLAWGPLTQSQVLGLGLLLNALEMDSAVVDIRHAAYMMATVKHECADTWHPIVERGTPAYFSMYEPGTRKGSALGNTLPGHGARYKGRGYVQITGLDNYTRIGISIGMGDVLRLYPEKVLDPPTAYQIMSVGMRDGLFTGARLGKYIAGPRCDYMQARRVINGMNRAELIAGYAVALEGMLRCALPREAAV